MSDEVATKAILTIEAVPRGTGADCTFSLEVPGGVDGALPADEQPPVVRLALAAMQMLANGATVGESEIKEISVVDKETGERRVEYEYDEHDPGPEQPDIAAEEGSESAADRFRDFIRSQQEDKDGDTEVIRAMKLLGRRKVAMAEGRPADVAGFPFAVTTTEAGELGLLASDLDLDFEELREIAMNMVRQTVVLLYASTPRDQWPLVACGQWIDGLFTGMLIARDRERRG